jgi:hypothetical protein
MTWRVCSPPWPARRNPVSWPGRRQCGLPSAGRPPRAASPPLPGGQCGADGSGTVDEIVPAPGWPRRWSRQWLGWAASSRPTRTCCPAPFRNWPTWPSRRRLRLAPVRPSPPPWGRDGARRARPRPPASRFPGRAIRRASLRPARRPLRNRASCRRPRGHPAMTAPARVADPAGGPRRARRRRHRLVPARRPGRRRSLAGASPRDPRSRPRCIRTSLNPDRRGCIRAARACSLSIPASFPARRRWPTMKANSQSTPVTTWRRRRCSLAWNGMALDGPP